MLMHVLPEWFSPWLVHVIGFSIVLRVEELFVPETCSPVKELCFQLPFEHVRMEWINLQGQLPELSDP